MDEHGLAALEMRPVDKGLPRGQRYEGEGGCFFHGESGRLERDVVLLDRDQLGEGADAVVVRACVDRVSGLEAPDSGADADYDSGEVVPQDQGQAVLQDGFDLAVPDFGVEWVDARGVDLDQDVVIPQLRVRHLDGANVVIAAVFVDRERLHDRPYASRNCRVFDTKAS